jgi:hypothetical protein
MVEASLLISPYIGGISFYILMKEKEKFLIDKGERAVPVLENSVPPQNVKCRFNCVFLGKWATVNKKRVMLTAGVLVGLLVWLVSLQNDLQYYSPKRGSRSI